MSLDDLPRIHPRVEVVRKATRDIEDAIGEAVRKYDVTFIELVQILTSAIASWARYALRAERHPEDPSKPADAQ